MSVVYICIGMIVVWATYNIYRSRKTRNRVICVVESNCTGCGRCVKRCTRGVLEMQKTETAKFAVVKNPNKCNACGDCLSKCKFNALKLVERV
jgi:NAD-dependent dihydropyrimidine dehydrogenase PreA subunit